MEGVHDVQNVGDVVEVLDVFRCPDHLGQENVRWMCPQRLAHGLDVSPFREEQHLKGPSRQDPPNHPQGGLDGVEGVQRQSVTPVVKLLPVFC